MQKNIYINNRKPTEEVFEDIFIHSLKPVSYYWEWDGSSTCKFKINKKLVFLAHHKNNKYQ